MTPQHFLVPIDFSESSSQALAYAVSLARQLKARITLLHIIQAPPLAGGDMGVALPQTYLQEIEDISRRDMEAYRQSTADEGVAADVVLVHGVPFQEILETAKAHHADLIVMGTHGRTGLSHVLLGSVAEKVVRMAHCPVLVARQQTVA